MASFDFEKQSHRRLNPLTGDWVLVSPGRTARPWKGQTEAAAPENVPTYDPQCYMCPGNKRASGKHNPSYTGTFVFENDYAALQPGGSADEENVSGLLVARAEQGNCRVVCFLPRHDLTLAWMSNAELRAVVDVWTEQYQLLGSDNAINSVLIFENRGAMMGASNPHPHGQIWANATLPNEPAKEQASFVAYQQTHSTCLLCAYLKIEKEKKDRIVCENDEFVSIVPFWAVWPFETIVISKQHAGSLEQFSESGRDALADILHRVTARYDNLFQTSFPYSMGWHGAPSGFAEIAHWQLHAHFYPPLLRSATVKKFMVGYEMLAEAQRDLTPEQAAQTLRDQSEIHFKERNS